jgi:hypothetical protein
MQAQHKPQSSQAKEEVMINPKLIEQQWRSFYDAIKLAECTATQQREMKRAFFAGARGLLHTMMNALSDTGNPDDVTDYDEKIMECISDELDAFGEEVKAGRA